MIEYVPEREEDEDADARDVVGDLEQDHTEEEDVEEEVEQAPDQRALEMLRRTVVVEVVREMLAERDVDVELLAVLTDHEREALTFLRAAVEGRTAGGEFLYAETRLEQLNLVLADLQPLLSVGNIAGLDSVLVEVIDGIEALRQKLEMLSEADDEILEALFEAEAQAADDGQDDQDDQGDQGDQGDAAGEVAPEATTGEPEKKVDKRGERLWKRIFKRGKTPDEATAPAPGVAPGAAKRDAPANDAGDGPRPSTVWDPDDKRGA